MGHLNTKTSSLDNIIRIRTSSTSKKATLFSYKIQAGFPSPGENYEESSLDFNEYLVGNNKAATYAMRVTGDSMIGAGIHEGDILVINRSIKPINGKIVVAVVDGEFTVKRFNIKNNKIYLAPENPEYKTIDITNTYETTIWGVVTNVVKDM